MSVEVNNNNNVVSISEQAADVNVREVAVNGDPNNVVVSKTNTDVRVTSIGAVITSGASDKHYTHNQVATSAEWTVTHNLNKKPSVMVVDSGDSVVIGEIVYLSNNQVKLKFSAAFSGKAYFN